MSATVTARIPRNPLETLGDRHAPSKRMHDYLKHYWTHFRDVRESVRTVLEIGVQAGRSLRMWREFFPHATIHGLDTNATCMRHEGDRIRIHIGDQNDRARLARLCREIPEPDIIIDDGSHRADDQILTFDALFPHVRAGGCYVIEDIGVHPGKSRHKTFERLQQLIDHINYWPPGFPGENWPELTSFPGEAKFHDRHVVGLAVYRYIAFVFKGRNPQDTPYLPFPTPPPCPQSVE